MKCLLVFLAVIGTALTKISTNHKNNMMEPEEEEIDIEELVDDEMIMTCLNNGNQQAYQRAKFARQKLSECSSTLLQSEKLLVELRAAILTNGEGMGPVAQRFCKIYQLSGKRCLKQYLADLTPCLNKTQADVEELVVRMAETSWDFACQKNGLRATMLLKNSSLSCVEVQSPGIIECIAPYYGYFQSAGDPARAVAQILVDRECSKFTRGARCIVEKLQQCPDLTAAIIVSGSFNETLRISPCAGYVEPNEDQITQKSMNKQHMEVLSRIEASLQHLEETRNNEEDRRKSTYSTMMTILQNQANVLEQINSVLDRVVPLLNKGKGKKY